MDVTVKGIDICASDEQSLNACLSINLREEGFSNETCFNDVHFPNASILIQVIEEGIVMLIKDEHSSQKCELIEVNEEGISNVILCNEKHC